MHRGRILPIGRPPTATRPVLDNGRDVRNADRVPSGQPESWMRPPPYVGRIGWIAMSTHSPAPGVKAGAGFRNPTPTPMSLNQDRYRDCLIKPMSDNDQKPLIKAEHLVDAFIVAGIVFFSVLGGDALLGAVAGKPVLITPNQLAQRMITAGLAFGLTFLAQWARHRGIQLKAAIFPKRPN